MRKLLVIFVLIFNLWGDLPPPEGYQYVWRNIYITNVNEYPDYVLIGYLYLAAEHQYVIEENKALRVGTSLDTGSVFVMKRELFDTYGGLDEIDFDTLAQKKKEATYFPFPFPHNMIEDNCSIKKDDYYYAIESINNANITFKLQKRILTDRDGATQTITY